MSVASEHIDDALPKGESWGRARLRKRFARPRLTINLTSLIDVTFLLLIYFMVATTMSMGEEAYRMDLPDRAGRGAQGDPFKLDDEPLRIAIATTGLLPGDYTLRIDGPFGQPKTFDDLHRFLAQHQINESNTGGLLLFEPDQPIIIQPSRGTRWDHAMEAFNAAARARYTNITFAPAE